MNRTYLVIALVSLFLFLGCITGGNARGIAEEMKEKRTLFIPSGLLVPPQAAQQEKYREALLGFRKKVSEQGGLEAGPLNSYLNGSLALLEMNQKNTQAIELLENVNPELPECGANTPLQQAISFFQQAREKSEYARQEFQKAKENTSMANGLGADYILNVIQTTRAISSTHSERINDLKSACE